MDQNHTLGVLGGLVEICLDGHDGYNAAAHAARDPELKKALRRLARGRQDLAEELGTEMRRHGGTPPERGTARAALHRGWIELASAPGFAGDHALLKEVQRGERATLRKYREAVVTSLPAPVKALLERQLMRVFEARAEVRQLSAAC